MKNISPRCALKIDLQKAFDSIHWGFIPIILNALEFPSKLIDWISACYSNASYSIAFNGTERGIFSFHPKYKKIGLTHLTFADDLLIFCKGNLESVMGVVFVLDYFYKLSGLKLNALKCEIFTAGISVHSTQNIINFFGFQHGLLLVRYLGIPLLESQENYEASKCRSSSSFFRSY
ncbi:uncharacterized protein LOC120122722 [Hibiscus syriacus]|uniref:uncharacterized protein LOC120122722 n=1 Tax=Hibiscus syriacus TaxID=106335 RepID=UPI001921329F|nr:uncharacterized protein LOC120122722 [Hibiscus syriacus]